MFEQPRHNNISIFIISQNYYELPKRIICANGNTYHIFQRNKFRDFQKLYQDKVSLELTLTECKSLT